MPTVPSRTANDECDTAAHSLSFGGSAFSCSRSTLGGAPNVNSARMRRSPGCVGHLLIDPAALGVVARADDDPGVARFRFRPERLQLRPTARRRARDSCSGSSVVWSRCAVLRTSICASRGGDAVEFGVDQPRVIEPACAPCRTGRFRRPALPSRRSARRCAAGRAARPDGPVRRRAPRGRSRRRSCRSASAADRPSTRDRLFRARHRAGRRLRATSSAAMAEGPPRVARAIPPATSERAPARCTRRSAAAPTEARADCAARHVTIRFGGGFASVTRTSSRPCSGAPYSDRGDRYNGTAPGTLCPNRVVHMSRG